MKLASLLFLLLAVYPRPARAQLAECARVHSERVAYAASFEPENEAMAQLVARHLAAALAARAITVCTARDASDGALAHIHIHVMQAVDGTAHAVIAIGDQITQKRSERTLELTTVPPDGRALAIASSADELLRASWAELAMTDAPARAAPAPPVVIEAAVASVRPAASVRRVEIMPELTVSALHRRQAFGAKLRFAYFVHHHVGLLLGAGASYGLTRHSTHGSVRADAFELEAGLGYTLTAAEARLGLGVELVSQLARLSFVADANKESEASSFRDWALTGVARLRGFWGGGPLRAALSLGVSYGLVPKRATDEGKTVSSTEGVGAEICAGVGTFF